MVEFLMSFFGILVAVFVLGLLVAVHEAGHLLMAKWSNVRVDTFSIGMGKAIWGFQYGETYYQIGRLPFGGFCGFGEEENKDDPDPRALMNSPLWARLLTVIGGSLFNIIFAFLVMIIMFSVGFKEMQLPNQIFVPQQITNPQDGTTIDSPAYASGLRSGDYIIQIDSEIVNHFKDIPVAVSLSADSVKTITYTRDNTTNTVQVTTIEDYSTGLDILGVQPVSPAIIGGIVPNTPAHDVLQEEDQIIAINNTPIQYFHQIVEQIKDGNTINLTLIRNQQTNNISITPALRDGIYLLGIQAAFPQTIETQLKAPNVISAFGMSYDYIGDTISQIGASLVKLFSGRVNVQENLSGPVRIIAITGEIAQTFDFTLLIKFTVMLSLALATFNLLPFPGLDGGHIVLQTARSIFKDNTIAEKIITTIEQAGIILLLTMAVFVLFNDVKKIFFEKPPTQQVIEKE